MPRFAPLAALLLAAAPLRADPPPLAAAVEAAFAKAPAGTRWGLLVVDAEGREVFAHNPDMRFVPASNTKLYTTAAAYALLPGIDADDSTGGAGVVLSDNGDIILIGHGDARLSSAPDCAANCLATLADAVAARTHRVHDVIGDDAALPDERWSPGMSWNNQVTEDGTAPSALTLDDNALTLAVTPGAAPGQPASAAVPPYFTLDNAAITAPPGTPTTLAYLRTPGSRVVHLSGSIAADAKPWKERLGIDEPADYAATRFAELLRARGVSVEGAPRARHRPNQSIVSTDGASITLRLPRPETFPIARLTPPPLAADVVTINKKSQNLHAELLLRRIGLSSGTGSLADGLKAEEALFTRIGIPRSGWDLYDGSGMSSYNRVTPRATVALLRWGLGQPWGAAWKASFAVGGVDGTLKRRFLGTPLAGKVHAKTGTLNAANALAGTITAASGRELTFAAYAADMAQDASATAAIDSALNAIAARE